MNITSIKNIFKSEYIKFYYKDEHISLGEYEEINIDIIDEIIGSEDELNTMIYIGDKAMYIIAIIQIAILTYIKNITNTKNYIMDYIDIGDKVYVDGKIGEYQGTYISEYGNGIKVFFKKGDTSIMLEESLYRVLPYNGRSDISNMSNRVSTKGFITKELIATLIDDKNSKDIIKRFIGIINNTNVIVIPNKSFIESILKSLNVEFKDKLIPFTEVFPCSYITSSQNIVDYPGNYAKQNPLLNFTTSIATAYEFVRSNRNIEKVFIFDGQHIDKDYVDLENIISRKSIKQVNIISDSSKLINMANIIENSIIKNKENNLYAWTENAILNLTLYEYLDKKLEVFNKQQEIIDKCLDKDYNVELIKFDEMFESMHKTRKALSRLLKSNLDDRYKNIFLINGYGLLNTLETTPFNIKFLEENIDKIGIKIHLPRISLENLKEVRNEIITDDTTERLINEIVENIEHIIEKMYMKNYKWDRLIGYIAKYRAGKYYLKNNYNRVNVLLIVRKHYEAMILTRYLKEQCINVDVVSIDKYNVEDIYDIVFVLGYYNQNKHDIFNDPYLLNTKFLLYKSELNRYKHINNRNKYLKSILEKNNKLYDMLEIEAFDPININEQQDELARIDDKEEIIDITEIEEYIESNKFKIDFTNTPYYQNSDVKTIVNAEKALISENGEYALLTKQYRAQVIDWEKNKIIKTNINSIKEGDSILFINEYLDEESNIVIDIIENLIKNNYLNTIEKSEVSVEEKYKLTKYWKECLERYREREKQTLKDLSNSLKVQGERVHHVTIGSWINNKRIIGPRSKSTYMAIANLIDDKYMKANIENIYQASRDIRKLHTQIKTHIDKIIVNNFFNKQNKNTDKITNVISEMLGDTNQYITTVQVRKISNYNKQIPAYLSNKLLDIENTY
ncbi:hypothetical protein HCG68_04200 [Paeniclostridium sordellii]|nr:hypothetical protein [Paeniclostridium sordellii]